jgi:hypothetical protein
MEQRREEEVCVTGKRRVACNGRRLADSEEIIATYFVPFQY